MRTMATLVHAAFLRIVSLFVIFALIGLKYWPVMALVAALVDLTIVQLWTAPLVAAVVAGYLLLNRPQPATEA